MKQTLRPRRSSSLVDELRSALWRAISRRSPQQAKREGQSARSSRARTAISWSPTRTSTRCSSNIEKLAKSGSKDLAEQMLSELKDILERLQTGNFADNAKQQRASKMMKDLNDLVSKQQKLLDDTFKAKREQSRRSAGRSAFECEPARAADGVRSRHVHGAVLRHAAGGGRGRRHVAEGQRKFSKDGPAAATVSSKASSRRASARPVRRARPAPGRARQKLAEPDRPLPHRRREPA